MLQTTLTSFPIALSKSLGLPSGLVSPGEETSSEEEQEERSEENEDTGDDSDDESFVMPDELP